MEAASRSTMRPAKETPTARSTLSDPLALGAAHAFRLATAVAASGIIARHLGAAEFGVFAWHATALSLGAFVLDPGGGVVLTRRLAAAEGSSGPLLAALFRLRFAAGVVLLIVLVLVTALPGPGTGRLDAALLTGLAFPCLFGATAAPVLLAGGRARVLATSGAVIHAAFLAAVGLVAILGLPGGACFLALGLRESSRGIWLLAAARRGLPRGVRPAFAEAIAFLRSGRSAALAAVASALALHLDVFTAGALLPAPDFGAYALPVRLAVPLMLVSGVLLAPVLPHWSRSSRAERGRSAAAVSFALGMAGLAVAAPLVILSADVLESVYGARVLSEAGGAVPALGLLSAATAAVWYGSVWTTALASAGRFARLLAISLSGLAATAGLCLLLIPRWGPAGAAAAVLGREILVAALARGAFRGAGAGVAPREAFRAALTVLPAALVAAVLRGRGAVAVIAAVAAGIGALLLLRRSAAAGSALASLEEGREP